MSYSFNTVDFNNYIAVAKQKGSDEGYELMNRFFRLNLFPFPTVYLRAGHELYRTRIHHNNEEFFYNEKELSYRTDLPNISSYGRCNKPHQGLFYCSDEQAQSYVEVSQMKTGRTPCTHYYTASGWIIRKDINVGFLLDSDKKNKVLMMFFLEWNKFFNSLNLADKENVIAFHTALTSQFKIPTNKSQIHYIVSAAYVNFLFNQWNDQNITIDGFAYPTCMNDLSLPNPGINYCFRPEIVGFNKSIELAGAIRAQFILSGKEFNEAPTAVKAKHIDNITGNITW